ncbi:hypothetical protein RRG08_002555 [Elysia crispata]|uniref:Uncharacterized protein n=1 Tax=Elysia crispata TaxID=231223 RepID=A0AAE0Y4K0_9GAST|nr:hypothetical protein RRG08_002555 [Elysia crispata]
MSRAKHLELLKARRENQSLPEALGVEKEEERRVPLDDRAKSQEALILSFIAENNLALSMTTPIINLLKELAKDQEAFNRVCLERTTVSYKLKYGVAKTITDKLVSQLMTRQ